MKLYSSCLVAAVTAKSSGKSQWPVVKKSDMIGLVAPAARYDYGYDYGYDSSEGLNRTEHKLFGTFK